MKSNPRLTFSLIISTILFWILLDQHKEAPAEEVRVATLQLNAELKTVSKLEVVYQVAEGAFWPVYTGLETCRYQLVEPFFTEAESQKFGVQFHEVFDPEDGEYYIGITPAPGFPKHTLLRTWDHTVEAVTGDAKLAILLDYRDRSKASAFATKPEE